MFSLHLFLAVWLIFFEMLLLLLICNKQGWHYGTVRLNFCEEVRYSGTVCFFCNVTGTVRRYGTPFL